MILRHVSIQFYNEEKPINENCIELKKIYLGIRNDKIY